MDDYLRQYIQEKKNLTFDDFLDKIKIPQNAMIPTNMNSVNLNQLRNPMNMPKIPTLPRKEIEPIHQDSLNIQQNIPNIPKFSAIPINQPNVNMFPRFISPAMNPIMLQHQHMIMKNPMYMQWMRSQMMQNMMGMNMLNNNLPNGNITNRQMMMMNPTPMNMNIMNIPINPSRSLQETKESHINSSEKELNVNVSEFIRNINPFDKPNQNIQSTQKETVATEEKEISIENDVEEDKEEEVNYFLKSDGLGDKNKNRQQNKIQPDPNENFVLNTNKTNFNHEVKNLEISNILKFVNILKKKNNQEHDDVLDEIPRDPRVKNKKK